MLQFKFFPNFKHTIQGCYKTSILSILYVLQLIVIQGYIGTTIEYNTSKIHQSTRGIVLSYKENQVNIWPKRTNPWSSCLKIQIISNSFDFSPRLSCLPRIPCILCFVISTFAHMKQEKESMISTRKKHEHEQGIFKELFHKIHH